VDENVDASPIGRDGTANVLAYQARLGATIEVSQRFDLTVGYRFYGTGERSIETNGVDRDGDGARVHLIEVGLRFGGTR
jgi:opacity protein-like surface antigen